MPTQVSARRRSRERTAWALAASRRCSPRCSPPAPSAAPAPAAPAGPRLAPMPDKTYLGRHRALAGRQAARLHAGERERGILSLGPGPGRGGSARDCGHGGGQVSVLVAGRPLPRVLRRGQAQEGRPRRRPALLDLRCGGRSRRNLESRRRDRLRALAHLGALSRRRLRRQTRCPDEARRLAARGGPPLSALSSGRPPFSLHDHEPRRSADESSNAIRVASLDGENRPLLGVLSNAQYAAGRLLYVRDDALLAQRFDPDGRLKGSQS